MADNQIKHCEKLTGKDNLSCLEENLILVEVMKDEKWSEGDSMYFAMEKETKMRCTKCGTYYKERICQDNYGGHYSQKYSKL